MDRGMDRKVAIMGTEDMEATDPGDSIWIGREAPEVDSSKLCWRVWRVVVVWMLACCFSEWHRL